jgi:hypothetical protein
MIELSNYKRIATDWAYMAEDGVSDITKAKTIEKDL